MNNKLSIIIPFIQEYPQCLFTIRSVAESLIESETDFEIIAVNNYCEQYREQVLENMRRIIRSTDLTEGLSPETILEISSKAWPKISLEDKSGPAIEAVAGKHPWLKYVKYTEKLSHWQAKRTGVEVAEGDTFLFIDAHCVPSANTISDMFQTYIGKYNIKFEKNQNEILSLNYYEKGTMHLPLTYKIMEYRKLIYKMVVEGPYHFYKFTNFRQENASYEVPVMSTCGMMISRKIYEKIGGWPTGLGIYGGGEHFMNYTLAVCGFKKWIYPHGVLTHHGERRDYHYLGDDMTFNKILAHYLFGGEKLALELTETSNGNKRILYELCDKAIKSGKEQRGKIKEIQKVNLKEFVNGWSEKV